MSKFPAYQKGCPQAEKEIEMDNEFSPESMCRPKALAHHYCDKYNASFHTFYRWILEETRRGNIPHYLIRNVVYVRPSEVEAYLQSIKKGPSHG